MKPTPPPRWAQKLLEWYCPPHLLDERFRRNSKRYGLKTARRLYGWEALGFFRLLRLKRNADEYSSPFLPNPIMIRNYLTIAWRNLLRNRLNSALTIVGLALGLACGLLIILHVKEELRFDKGFSKADRIYRLTNEHIGENSRQWAATSPILGVEMQQQLPGIERVVRFHRPYPDRVFRYLGPGKEPKQFEEKGGFYADSTVVDVFDLSFIKGDPRTALQRTNAIVLTESMAQKYFGNEDPLGKLLLDELENRPLTVTGVIRKFPFPSHLQFDYLISMSTWYGQTDQETQQHRGWAGFYNYILLSSRTSRSAVEAQLPGFMVRFYEAKGENRKEILATRRIPLQPITEIHLHSKLEKEMTPNSDSTYLYVFSIAAIFILLVASVNFINMATAQAFTRMKEVGVRKALGARKSQLFNQFLGDSFLLTLLAALLAILLVRLALPLYSELTDKPIRFRSLLTPDNAGFMALLTASISLLAGIYPAWFSSGFDPVSSLKGRKSPVSSVARMRKGLIVFQFAVSVFMIFSTIVVYRQMQFFQRKDLGFDQEQVVAVKLYGPAMREKVNAIGQEFLKNAAIRNVARVSTLPGDRFSTDMLAVLGRSEPASQMRYMWSDEQALPLLGVSLKAGRNFFRKAEGSHFSYILNEAAAKALRLQDPIGQKIVSLGDTGEVVGLVADFHFASLHTRVEPLVIVHEPNQSNYFLLKIKGDKLAETLQYAQSALARVVPGSVFGYSFLDEKLDRLYEAEQRTGDILKVFAVFAVLISCLGLFGLSAYTAQVRTKEIGIRKTLGATASGIVILLSGDFLRLVFLAVLIALPLAWWVMSRWLEGFAYAVPITGSMFAQAALLAISVAVLTISFQSVKAALMNPVKSLRSE